MKLLHTPSEQVQFSTHRIEALTDGVFAIAMTLMVLDLKLDELAHVKDSVSLWNALVGQSEGIVVFIISFLLLGSMWAIHMRQFEYITKTDRHLTMINTLRLLVVVFMPLSTSIAGAYHDVVLANVLLPINFFVLTVVSYWQWRYATSPNRKLASSKLTKQIIDEAEVRNRTVLVIAFLTIILAIWVGELAFLLFAFMPAFTKLIDQVRNRN